MRAKQKPTTAAPLGNPGATIRAVRQQVGITLTELGQRTGLAISTLSKLEMGKASLSLDKLLQISQGLGVDIAQLLEPAAAPLGGLRSAGRRALQRAGDGRLVDTPAYRHLYVASELLSKRFIPVMVEVRIRSIEAFYAEFGGLIRHPGEEFALILEGEVEFHSELYEPTRLGVGDSMYFDSDMGHAYIAVADGPCRLVSINASTNRDSGPIAPFVEPRPTPRVRTTGGRNASAGSSDRSASVASVAGLAPTPAKKARLPRRPAKG